MKIIQHIDGRVVHILNARADATQESIAVVEDIPAYVQKEGYSGELRYSSESGLYWEYIENPIAEETLSETEEKAKAYDIITGESE